MSAQAENRKQKNAESHSTAGFFISRSRFTAALILIALGGVFFLQQAGILDHGTNWWVIFIAIPGLVILGSALVTALIWQVLSGCDDGNCCWRSPSSPQRHLYLGSDLEFHARLAA